MKIAQFIKTCIIGSALFGSCYATDINTTKVTLSLAKAVKPEGIIQVKWEGLDKPRDQIILSVSTPSGFEPIAFVYTARGNPVMFQGPGSEVFEVSYKMYDGSILARLMVDCTKKATITDGMCKVLDQNKTHK